VSGLIKVVPVKWRGSGDMVNRDSPAGRVHVYKLNGGFSAQSRTFCAKGFERAFGVPVPSKTTIYRVKVDAIEKRIGGKE